MSDDMQSLQEISTQFPTIPLKYGVNRRTNKFTDVPENIRQVTLEMVSSWTGEVIKTEQEVDNASSGLVEFRTGDVLFSKLRPYLAKAFKADHRGAASPEFLVFDPTEFKARYLLYLLLSKEFIDRVDSSTYGAKMPRASWDFIGDIRVPCPSLAKQEKICEFLDQRTARIDTLINKNDQLINHLDEKKKAIITHSVTGTSIQQSNTKETGVPWLDKIPEDWDIIPLKFLAEVQTGIAKGRKQKEDDLKEVPYLRVANVQEGYLNLDNVKTLDLTEEELKRYSLQDGDVLMNEGGDYDKLGRGTVWEGQIEPCVHQNHVFCVRPNNREDSEWLSMLTQSDYLKHYFMMNAKQTTNLASISASNISKAPLVWPPKKKRDKILELINSETLKIEGIRDHILQITNLVKEKRESLIAAAVTGQIDITET